MRKIRDISEHEVVAVFLQAEINSVRFNHHILDRLSRDNKERSIIDNPDLESEIQNNYRMQILGEYRGYGKNHSLFEGFPSSVKWEKVMLSRDDLQKVKYINYDFWVELSQNTRLAKDAVKTIENGIEIYGQPNDGFIKAADAVKNGTKFPEMILVAANPNSDLVVIEGHLRLTAYLLAKENTPAELEAIVGYSPDITNWGLY